MSSIPPHKRTLPHFEISEQGLRELELWLRTRAATASSATGLVVQDEGVALPVEPIMDFVGSGVTATDDPGGTRTLVTIPGGTAGHRIEDEGTPLTQRADLNFVGSGVTAADTGGVTVVTIPGGSGYATVQDEGSALTQRAILDFAGAGVTATDDSGGSRTLVTIPGGSGTDVSVRVTNSTDQSISNNTNTTLAFDTERFDTASFHDNVTNNSRLTFSPSVSSKYLVFAHVYWELNTTGYRQAGILVNNNNFIALTTAYPVQATVGTVCVLSTVYDFINGDYVEVVVRQNSGGALNVKSQADYTPIFGAIKILG